MSKQANTLRRAAVKYAMETEEPEGRDIGPRKAWDRLRQAALRYAMMERKMGRLAHKSPSTLNSDCPFCTAPLESTPTAGRWYCSNCGAIFLVGRQEVIVHVKETI